jgi:ribosomal protein L40E
MCGRCGAANADNADFCGGCGAFLEFDEAGGTPVAGTTAPVTGASQDGSPTGGSAAGGGGGSQAGTAGTSPAAVQPDVTVQRRHRTVAVVDDRTRPGDILCPACGAGNPPDRRFCRRCGRSLIGGETVRIAWWRRLLLRLRRRPLAAGTRPVRRGRSRTLLPTAVVLVLVLVAIGSLPTVRPAVRRGYDAARGAVLDRFSQPTQFVPKSATASSSTKGASPNLVIDGANNTYWAPQVASPAKGEWCQIDLDRPVYVAKLLITPGVDTKEDTFRTQSRPARVEVVSRRDDGSVSRRTVELDDRPKAQEINIRASRVTRITVTILDAYGARPDRVVAIAEVEVFIRR